jgi:hypothetical protein
MEPLTYKNKSKVLPNRRISLFVKVANKAGKQYTYVSLTKKELEYQLKAGFKFLINEKREEYITLELA